MHISNEENLISPNSPVAPKFPPFASQNPVKTWLLAARPKTLGASIAPVLIGGSFAVADGLFHPLAFLAALLGAILIQIGTNFANDYFDHQKGADTKDRLGPIRATASGLISPRQMKRAFFATFGLAALVGVYLVARGGLPILIVGLLSLLFGYLYTGGPKPIAYLGGSELFVITFFGPIAVLGTYYVQTLQWSKPAFVAGLVPGFISAALLTVNNLRDREQDLAANKLTWAVRFGANFAKAEFVVLIVGAGLIACLLALLTQKPQLLAVALVIALLGLPLIKGIYIKRGSLLNLVLAGTGKLLVVTGATFFAANIL